MFLTCYVFNIYWLFFYSGKARTRWIAKMRCTIFSQEAATKARPHILKYVWILFSRTGNESLWRAKALLLCFWVERLVIFPDKSGIGKYKLKQIIRNKFVLYTWEIWLRIALMIQYAWSFLSIDGWGEFLMKKCGLWQIPSSAGFVFSSGRYTVPYPVHCT